MKRRKEVLQQKALKKRERKEFREGGQINLFRRATTVKEEVKAFES